MIGEPGTTGESRRSLPSPFARSVGIGEIHAPPSIEGVTFSLVMCSMVW